MGQWLKISQFSGSQENTCKQCERNPITKDHNGNNNKDELCDRCRSAMIDELHEIEEKQPFKRKTIDFLGEECDLNIKQYDNGRLALILVTKNGEPMAKCTINVPEEPLHRNEVVIKEYLENEGMLSALIKAGIVEQTGRYVELWGGIKAPICKVLINVYDYQ